MDRYIEEIDEFADRSGEWMDRWTDKCANRFETRYHGTRIGRKAMRRTLAQKSIIIKNVYVKIYMSYVLYCRTS